MYKRILGAGLFAGALAGLLAIALQFAFVQPTLLQAELYESGQLVHFGEPSTTTPAPDAGDGHDREHGAVSDLQRYGLGIAFSVLIYVGYGLLLIAAMAYANGRGVKITARKGLIWGVAAFVAVHLAPAISMPPETPGVAAASVEARQIWWFATVIAAAAAMGLIAFGRSPLAWGIAVILLVTPHIVGAPQPDAFAGAAPPEVAATFVSASLGVSFAAWALLGLFAGYFWTRFAPDEEQAGHYQTV